MLKLFRRHGRTRSGESTCKHKKTQHDPWLKCDCPVHVMGVIESSTGGKGTFLRQFTGTTALHTAQAKAAKAVSLGHWPTDDEMEGKVVEEVIESSAQCGKRIDEAIYAFLRDAKSDKGRNLREPTYVKYQGLLGRLLEEGPSKAKEPSITLKQYCADRGIETIEGISVEQLRDFRDTWRTGPRASLNHVQRLRTFYRFCIDSGWTKENPAKKLRTPKKIDKKQKWPFSPEEMTAIIEAAREAPLDCQQPITNLELEVFVLVMRYSGLRISDTAMLTIDRLQGDNLFLYAIKGDSRQAVFAPLPTWVANLLRSVPVKQGKYFFCAGSTRLETNDELWLRRLWKVWALCREKGFFKEDDSHGKPTSHRFRHTFAIELLQSGEADLEDVSVLLGHASSKITREHYGAWVPGRQQNLTDKVRRANAGKMLMQRSA